MYKLEVENEWPNWGNRGGNESTGIGAGEGLIKIHPTVQTKGGMEKKRRGECRREARVEGWGDLG